MINPFLLPSAERLRDWKQFRTLLADKPDCDRFAEVAKYWSRAPLLNIAYDVEAPQTWPTPWEVMNANQWCRKSVAIGMEFTLRLSGLPADRMCLKFILDRDIQDMLFILEIDRQWTLNYDWGSVVPYPNTDHAIIKRIRFVDHGYSIY